MKPSRNLILLILFLAIIASSLLVWQLFLSPKEEVPPLEIQPTPTMEPKGKGEPGLYEELGQETNEEFPLLSQMPHREENWTADYLGPLHLEVVVKKGSLEQVKNEVLKWIQDQGVDPATHKIDFKTSF